jgi:hypothetical protein
MAHIGKYLAIFAVIYPNAQNSGRHSQIIALLFIRILENHVFRGANTFDDGLL